MSDRNEQTKGDTPGLLNRTLSRRKLLASIGAGAALLSAGVYGIQSRGKEGSTDHGDWTGDVVACGIDEIRKSADLRPGTVYYVTDPGREGPFLCDPDDGFSADNGGTIVVAVTGMRLKRVFQGGLDVRWFGALGDGRTDDTAALQSAIQACFQAGGGTVHIPRGVYVCTDTLVIPSGVVVRGAGLDEWVPSAQNIRKRQERGTHLMFSGSGPKKHTLYGVTDMSVAGGVRENPDESGQYYKLTNFYYADASGNAPAAQKPFSAAVLVDDSTQSGILDLRITHSYMGVEGFNGARNTTLGDDWDIGLWVKNASQGRYDRVQVVGYWRMYGVLVTSMNDPADPSLLPTAESNRFEQCVMSGKVGMGFRSGDVYRCLSAGSGTLTVPWSPSNPFPAGGGVFRIGGTNYTYTGTVRESEQSLKLTGVAPDPRGVQPGTEIRTSASNFGFAGTVMSDCYISGLDHSSGVVCTNSGLNPPFDTPSACIEISGEPVRGLHFLNCTIQTREEVLLHLHDARDIEFKGCYFETKTARSAVGTSFNLPAGARFIASPLLSGSTAPYPAGESNDINFLGCSGTDSVICRQPAFRRTGSTRFSADSGLFTPRGFVDDTLTGGRIQSFYPIRLPKGMPIAILDYRGSRLGTIAYNEEGELDIRSGTGDVLIRRGTDTRMRITGSELQLAGASVVPDQDNSTSLGSLGKRWKHIYAAQPVVNTSDAREKEDVCDVEQGIELLRQLRPVRFRYREDGDEGRPHYGLIAQEVKEVLDRLGIDAAAYEYDSEADAHGLRYTEFIPLLIQAVTELKAEVEKLERRFDSQ